MGGSKGELDTFTSQVLRDEAFTFQLGVVSGGEPLSDLRITFDGFPDSWAETLTCFNCGGIDEKGVSFTKRSERFRGNGSAPLDRGPDPGGPTAGTVEGTVTVTSSNRGSRTVHVSLEVQDRTSPQRRSRRTRPPDPPGLVQLHRGHRPGLHHRALRAVTVESSSGGAGHTLSILGRRIELGPTGLPDQIFSYFTPELTHFAEEPEPILALPLALEVLATGGRH